MEAPKSKGFAHSVREICQASSRGLIIRDKTLDDSCLMQKVLSPLVGVHPRFHGSIHLSERWMISVIQVGFTRLVNTQVDSQNISPCCTTKPAEKFQVLYRYYPWPHRVSLKEIALVSRRQIPNSRWLPNWHGVIKTRSSMHWMIGSINSLPLSLRKLFQH